MIYFAIGDNDILCFMNIKEKQAVFLMGAISSTLLFSRRYPFITHCGKKQSLWLYDLRKMVIRKVSGDNKHLSIRDLLAFLNVPQVNLAPSLTII